MTLRHRPLKFFSTPACLHCAEPVRPEYQENTGHAWLHVRCEEATKRTPQEFASLVDAA